MARTGIQVDITNPADIRAKRDRIRRQIGQTERNIESEKEELRKLRDAAQRLAVLLGEQAPEDQQAGSSVERVVAAVLNFGGPTTVAEVTRALDPPIKRKTVGWALWRAAQDGRIMNLETGVYAPDGYNPVKLNLNGADAATEGSDES